MKVVVILILLVLCIICSAMAIIFDTSMRLIGPLAADQAIAESVPLYSGQIGTWMFLEPTNYQLAHYWYDNDEDGDGSSIMGARVSTTFDGYEGEPGWLMCDPRNFIVNDEVYVSFNYGSLYDNGNTHMGIDYGVGNKPGAQLYAPMSGKVVFANYHEQYGYLVVVENMGVRMYLAHLEGFAVQNGEILEAGDYVGLIGNTGNSDGYHLHLEIRVQTDEEGNTADIVHPGSIIFPGQTQPCTTWDNFPPLRK